MVHHMNLSKSLIDMQVIQWKGFAYSLLQSFLKISEAASGDIWSNFNLSLDTYNWLFTLVGDLWMGNSEVLFLPPSFVKPSVWLKNKNVVLWSHASNQ